MSRQAADQRIRSLRPPKPGVNPWVAHGSLIEDERRANGSLERALTVFLAGAECPFTCSFCDLWRLTIDGPTPAGALPAQLRGVLESQVQPLPGRLKLYNASNFFDRRAVPAEDVPAMARLAEPFAGVTVESHANMIGPLTLEFGKAIRGRLEVAIGLETVHPVAFRHLNKRMDLSQFDRAAGFLADHDIDLRAFVLLGVPYIEPQASVEWTVRAVEYAARRGAAKVSVIPVRGGNGELERLQALGRFTPPSLSQLEQVVEQCLSLAGAAVAADLWDLDRLPACAACRPARVERLRRLNLLGTQQPPVLCNACGVR